MPRLVAAHRLEGGAMPRRDRRLRLEGAKTVRAINSVAAGGVA